MRRPDLLTDALYSTMKDRLANDASLNQIIVEWIGKLNYKELKDIVDAEGVPVNLIYNIEDIFNDPHYKARNNIVEMDHPTLGTIKMPGIVPVFSATPGEIKWVGPELGAYNKEVYQGLLGLSDQELEVLKSEEVI